MSCGDHLQWGYVDQPPLIPFLIHVCRAVLGDSLRSIRFIPALASSLLVVQTAVLAREFGGRRYALLLSAICARHRAAISLQWQPARHQLPGTQPVDGLRLFRHPRHQAKRSALLAVVRRRRRLRHGGEILHCRLRLGIVVGLLLTEQRRTFLNKWIWLGGLAAFLIFLPNLLWNIHYDWPFVQLMRAIKAEGRDVVLGPFHSSSSRRCLVNPLTRAPLARGIVRAALLRAAQALSRAGMVLPGLLRRLLCAARQELLPGPVYPMLLAAGAVVFESALDRPESGPSGLARPRLQWLKPVIVVVLLASGMYLVPIVVPVLSPEHFLAYTKTLPFKLPVMEHSHARAALPQWYCRPVRMERNRGRNCGRVEPPYARGTQQDCGIFAQDYGQAGAIDFFGRRRLATCDQRRSDLIGSGDRAAIPAIA